MPYLPSSLPSSARCWRRSRSGGPSGLTADDPFAVDKSEQPPLLGCELDAYLGPWTLVGSSAYFTGRCPACGAGTVSLWVTKDGGRTFHRYAIPFTLSLSDQPRRELRGERRGA